MTLGLLFMMDWLVTSRRKGLDLLVIGSIEDIEHLSLAFTRSPLVLVMGSSGRTVRNS